jgi:hypothetical protein
VYCKYDTVFLRAEDSKLIEGARGEIKTQVVKDNVKIIVLDGNDLKIIFSCRDISDKTDALRNSGALVGDIVAILGIDGLGHLGIQFAAKMGFKSIAIGRGKEQGGACEKARRKTVY